MFIANKKRLITRIVENLVLSLIGYLFPHFTDILDLNILVLLVVVDFLTGTRKLCGDYHCVCASGDHAFGLL